MVDAIVGRVAGPRTSPQPDTSAPDPRQVYIPRAYRAAGDEVADLYRAQGYQTVEVGDPIIASVEDQDVVDVAIPIRQGVRWQIASVVFSGNRSVSSEELAGLTELDVGREGGQALSFDDVESARRAILKYYRDRGHLYAQLAEELRPHDAGAERLATKTSTSVDIRRTCERIRAEGKLDCPIELVFRVVEGPRVLTEDIIVKGVERTWDSIIENEVVLRSDDVLRAKDMEQTRDNLLRLGLFDVVNVSPLDADEVGSRKDVLVEVKERDNYFLELGGGSFNRRRVAWLGGVRATATCLVRHFVCSFRAGSMCGCRRCWSCTMKRFASRSSHSTTPLETFGRLEYEVAAGSVVSTDSRAAARVFGRARCHRVARLRPRIS